MSSAVVCMWMHLLSPVCRKCAASLSALPLNLADASIAEAAARLSLRHVLSVDADFDVYRDARGQPLVDLLRT